MSKALGMIAALTVTSFLSACASSQPKTAAIPASANEAWEVSEVPFIQAVKVKTPVKSEVVENNVRKNHKQN